MAGIGEMLSGLFSGPAYQSQGGALMRPDGSINYGDPNLPSDFFRASQASMQPAPQAANIPIPPQRPAGLGAPPAQAAPMPQFQMNPATPAQPPFQLNGNVPPVMQNMPRIAPTTPEPAPMRPPFISPDQGPNISGLLAQLTQAPPQATPMPPSTGRMPDIQAPVRAPPQPPQFGLPNPYAPQMLTDPRRMQSKHFQPRHQPDYGLTSGGLYAR